MGDSVRAPLQASGERWRLGECGERWRLGEVSWAVGVCSRVVLRTPWRWWWGLMSTCTDHHKSWGPLTPSSFEQPSPTTPSQARVLYAYKHVGAVTW